jgi:purine-cytosine permease-like protein
MIGGVVIALASAQGPRMGIPHVILAGCCMVALGASADLISEFIGLILALLLVLVPWASINLIDFYLIKRGCYDITSIFRADGGIYGRFNLHAIIAYFIGIVVQLPFANTSLYVGPYANLVDGADLSWLVGLVVTIPLYYCRALLFPHPGGHSNWPYRSPFGPSPTVLRRRCQQESMPQRDAEPLLPLATFKAAAVYRT